MSDELTNDQIALLCDVGEFDLTNCTADKRSDLKRLISEGYIEPVEGHPASAYQLTVKGSDFLGKRGAGLNEA